MLQNCQQVEIGRGRGDVRGWGGRTRLWEARLGGRIGSEGGEGRGGRMGCGIGRREGREDGCVWDKERTDVEMFEDDFISFACRKVVGERRGVRAVLTRIVGTKLL